MLFITVPILLTLTSCHGSLGPICSYLCVASRAPICLNHHHYPGIGHACLYLETSGRAFSYLRPGNLWCLFFCPRLGRLCSVLLCFLAGRLRGACLCLPARILDEAHDRHIHCVHDDLLFRATAWVVSYPLQVRLAKPSNPFWAFLFLYAIGQALPHLVPFVLFVFAGADSYSAVIAPSFHCHFPDRPLSEQRATYRTPVARAADPSAPAFVFGLL